MLKASAKKPFGLMGRFGKSVVNLRNDRPETVGVRHVART